MKQEKIVLHIIARMNVGGTARYIKILSRELPKFSYRAVLAIGNVQGQEIEDDQLGDLQILRVPSFGRRIHPILDLKSYLELRKIVKLVNPDIIHTHTFKSGLLGRLLFSGIPKVHTFHGHLLEDPEFKGFKSRVITFIERFLAHKTKFLVTVGQKVSEELLVQKVGNRTQYINIPPGVEPLTIPSREDSYRSLGLPPPTSPVVGWMARVTTVKNPWLALEVARLMPKTQFLMAGGGDLFNKVRNVAPPNVKVLGWVNAADLISASDVILATSENEGIPIALIESQMAGKPVVTTDVGSVSEVVLDGVTGFLVKKSASDIVEKIGSLLDDSELLLDISQNATYHSLKNFSVAEMVKRHYELYDRVLN